MASISVGWIHLVNNRSHGFSQFLPSSFSSVLQPLPAEPPSILGDGAFGEDEEMDWEDDDDDDDDDDYDEEDDD